MDTVAIYLSSCPKKPKRRSDRHRAAAPKRASKAFWPSFGTTLKYDSVDINKNVLTRFACAPTRWLRQTRATPVASCNKVAEVLSHSYGLNVYLERRMYMFWKFASLGLIVAAVALAGCSSPAQTPQAPVADSEQGRCESSAAAFAVGKKATPELVEQARAKAGARNVRLLKPDDMVTLEYRSDRLNLNADDNAIITRVNCG
jgi:hypothetical protein